MRNLNLFLMLLASLFFACRQKNDSLNTAARFAPEIHADRWHVGILVMDGVYNTEFTAPFDIFQHTQFREGIKSMDVFTVAEKSGPIRTFEGIRFLPDFTFADAPEIDIFVVPSAEHHLDSDLENAAMIAFVKKTGSRAKFILSLCDGAFVLAKAGLLDSIQSTTFPDDVEKMRAMFPKLSVLEEVSFVHDGRCITSMGGARSFEAALYLCERLYGKPVADRLAHGLVINWNLEDVPNVSPDLEE